MLESVQLSLQLLFLSDLSHELLPELINGVLQTSLILLHLLFDENVLGIELLGDLCHVVTEPVLQAINDSIRHTHVTQMLLVKLPVGVKEIHVADLLFGQHLELLLRGLGVLCGSNQVGHLFRAFPKQMLIGLERLDQLEEGLYPVQLLVLLVVLNSALVSVESL